MELKSLLQKNKKSFIIYIIGAILTTPSNVLLTLALSYSFKLLEVTSKTEIIKIIIITGLLAFLPVLFQVISRTMRIGFMKDVLSDVRMMSYEKLMDTHVNEFSSTPLETYESKLIADINLFEQEFFMSLLNMIFTFGSYIISIIILFFISKELAFLTVGATAGIYIITLVYEKSILQSKAKVVEKNFEYQKSLTNILNGLETIKLYQATKRFMSVFTNDIYQYEKVKADDFKKNQHVSNLISAISFLMQSVAFIFAAYLFTKGKIEVTMLVVALSLAGTLMWTIHSGMEKVNRFKSSILIYDDLVLYYKAEDKGVDFKFEDELKVKNLNFSYKSKPILKNINLKIKAKSKVLIYGESGSGKTTFINTITKNLDNYEGLITYDGVELRNISYHSFIDSVGYVRQEHFLFDETIKGNIILDKDYDEKRFNEVLNQSGLVEYVEGLEDQADHYLVDNGSNISGGQRQRINIARELYQDKDILFFDEPSASLDDYNASVIYSTILNLDKTVIIISHRHLEFLQNKVDQEIDLSKEVDYE